MKRLSILFILIIVFSAACTKQDSPIRLIPEDYRNWASSHDGFLEYPIPGHMDNLRKIYFSPEAASVDPGEDYPDGTVIIKEIYKQQSSDKPFQLTVMVKDHESPKSIGGWLWVVKNTVDNSEQVITSEFCFTCHTDANVAHPYGDKNSETIFRDYVFIPIFTKWPNAE